MTFHELMYKGKPCVGVLKYKVYGYGNWEEYGAYSSNASLIGTGQRRCINRWTDYCHSWKDG